MFDYIQNTIIGVDSILAKEVIFLYLAFDIQ